MLKIDAAQQAVFDSGNEVGALARQLMGPGILVEHVDDIDRAIAETSALIADHTNTTLYEAAFRHDGVVVRADVLQRKGNGYDLIEVKGAGSVKPQYINDCATQAWVIEACGIILDRIFIAHIDTRFIYHGDSKYEGLLHCEDVTRDVRDRMREVPNWVSTMQGVLSGDEPAIATGEQCTDPYPCPFYEHCRAQEPADAQFPLKILRNGGKLAKQLHDEGFRDVRDIPESRLSNANHKRIRAVSISGEAILDARAGEICAAMDYPRHYLDFESIGFAIPRWAGTRPFQQIPFQWSCHTEKFDGSLSEKGFLDLSGDLPVQAFAESLIEVLGSKGAIIVYNQSFEAMCIKAIAALLPDLADPLLALIERMVDLLPITRKHYYHPAMMGSWSIKAVLPTIAPELSYENLDDVAEGTGAQLAYRECIDPLTTTERRAALDQALRRYCANDTLAMVRLVERFSRAK